MLAASLAGLGATLLLRQARATIDVGQRCFANCCVERVDAIRGGRL
jgi:hypothetical protein